MGIAEEPQEGSDNICPPPLLTLSTLAEAVYMRCEEKQRGSSEYPITTDQSNTNTYPV
jgi:hypothetical protein